VFSTFPLQLGAVQTVSAAYFAQPPRPSQLPVSPQVERSVAAQIWCGSSAPCGVGQQVPTRPLWLQLTQAPAQAVLQQIPSAQKLDAQSEPLLQDPPIGFSPQLPATHLTVGMQSASELQVSTQAFVCPSQLKGAQICAGPAAQVPAPSQ
jgi:hypothetical protein